MIELKGKYASAKVFTDTIDVMRIIKTNEAAVLRKEFVELQKTQNLWTRSYFVSTAGDVSSATIGGQPL